MTANGFLAGWGSMTSWLPEHNYLCKPTHWGPVPNVLPAVVAFTNVGLAANIAEAGGYAFGWNASPR